VNAKGGSGKRRPRAGKAAYGRWNPRFLLAAGDAEWRLEVQNAEMEASVETQASAEEPGLAGFASPVQTPFSNNFLAPPLRILRQKDPIVW